MQREGADPTDMQVTDFLCDFCGRAWSEEVPFVEGHQGACICAKCLTVAYSELALTKDETVFDGQCVLCLEANEELPKWVSPIREEARVCRRCAKQAAGVLVKDKEHDWEKPK